MIQRCIFQTIKIISPAAPVRQLPKRSAQPRRRPFRKDPIMIKRSFRPVLLLAVILLLLSTACQTSLTPSNAPEGCKEAASEALDFAFYYPDTWELDRADGMLAVKYNVGNSLTKQYATITAQGYSLSDTGLGANDYWDKHKNEMIAAYGSLISFQNEKMETKLGGVVANRNRYAIVMDGVSYSFDQVICIRYGNVYLVTLCSPETNYADVVKGFDTVIESFRFLAE